MNEEIIETEEILERKEYVDLSILKKELIRLAYIKHYGKTPTKMFLHKFLKYINMEYENNTSKNNIDNRINSLCKAIETKMDKYSRVIEL